MCLFISWIIYLPFSLVLLHLIYGTVIKSIAFTLSWLNHMFWASINCVSITFYYQIIVCCRCNKRFISDNCVFVCSLIGQFVLSLHLGENHIWRHELYDDYFFPLNAVYLLVKQIMGFFFCVFKRLFQKEWEIDGIHASSV